MTESRTTMSKSMSRNNGVNPYLVGGVAAAAGIGVGALGVKLYTDHQLKKVDQSMVQAAQQVLAAQQMQQMAQQQVQPAQAQN